MRKDECTHLLSFILGESGHGTFWSAAHKMSQKWNPHLGDAGLKERLVGEYHSKVRLKDGDCGLQQGDVGEEEGDVGEYQGLIGE